MITQSERPVAAGIGTVQFAPAKSIWLWINLAGASVALTYGAIPGPLLAAAIALSLATLCLGHSVGLHRGVIHQTFRMPRPVRNSLLFLAMLAGLGGVRTWIHLHFVRDYWQNRTDCPPYFAYRHNLAADFFWNLHCGFRPTGGRRPDYVPARWDDDPWVQFLERTWWIWNLAVFAILFVTMDAHAALVLGPARVAGGILGHWFIGYWTHRWGTRRYTMPHATEHGSNSLVLGWLSFGEGFHNNHHAMPDSARMGRERFEFDLGWWVVLTLERLRLIEGVRSWSRGNATARGSVASRGPAPTRHASKMVSPRPTKTNHHSHSSLP